MIPEASDYRGKDARRQTDAQVRDHIASEIDKLRDKILQLKSSATEEGEEDMLEDLDRIDSRMSRTVEALRSEEHAASPFFEAQEVPEEDLSRVCSYDRALLEDLELLVTDVMGLKYETIGNLTLREAEGTLAAIELRVNNRKDVLEISGRP